LQKQERHAASFLCFSTSTRASLTCTSGAHSRDMILTGHPRTLHETCNWHNTASLNHACILSACMLAG
jgi:hypothetical protein